jgi:type IV pilus assembly protein PilM
MLKNVLNSENRILGLDIGSSNIKMAEVRHNPNGSKELITYGVYEHNIDLEGFWDTNKIEEFAKIIETIRKKANFKTLKTVVALQAKNVFVTSLDFDSSWTNKMIQDEITRQARFILPLPPEDMKLSWNVIPVDQSVQALTGKQRVVINALPNYIINNLTNLLNRCNLEGIAFENQTLSIARSLLSSNQNNTIIVDLGSKSTTYAMLIDGVLRNSFTSNAGLSKLDDAIASSLGINSQLAENFKKDLGLVNLFELPKEVQNQIRLIQSELLNYYQQNVKISQIPNQILLTGGGSLTPGILEELNNGQLPTLVKIANYAVNLNLGSNMAQSFSTLGPAFSTAVGLALRG